MTSTNGESARVGSRWAFGLERLTPWIHGALVLLPVLAVAGPFASVRPGAAGFPYFYRIVWALCLVAAVPLFWTQARRRRLPQAFALLTGWFAVWGALSLAWSPARDVGRTEVLAGTSALVGALVALILTGGRTDAVRRFRWGWMLAFAVNVVVVAWEILTGQHLNEVTGVQPWYFSIYSVAGTDTNPNGLSNFCIAAVAVLAAELVRRTRAGGPRVVLAGLVASLVIAAYVVDLTNSRAGVACLVVLLAGAALWCLRGGGRDRYAVTAALVLLAVALPLVAQTTFNQLRPATHQAQPANPKKDGYYQENATDAAKAADVATADAERVELSRSGLRSVATAPLQGHGAGSALTMLVNDPDYQSEREPAKRRILNLHNTYLELAVNYGLLGVLLPIAVPVLVVWTLLRRRRTTAARGRRLASPAVFEAFGILLAFVVTSVIASSSIGSPTFWLLLAYAAALAWNHEDADDPADPQADAPRPTTARADEG